MNAMLILMHMLTQQTMTEIGRNPLTNLFPLRREVLTQHSQQHGYVWLVTCKPEFWSSSYYTQRSSERVMQFGMRKSDGLNAPFLLLRGSVVRTLRCGCRYKTQNFFLHLLHHIWVALSQFYDLFHEMFL
uniref:Uncharacterized protein n=1 Tax=Glossina austeni TaxID=7395 RepID=A0A1A9VM72_GLOAU